MGGGVGRDADVVCRQGWLGRTCFSFRQCCKPARTQDTSSSPALTLAVPTLGCVGQDALGLCPARARGCQPVASRWRVQESVTLNSNEQGCCTQQVQRARRCPLQLRPAHDVCHPAAQKRCLSRFSKTGFCSRLRREDLERGNRDRRRRRERDFFFSSLLLLLLLLLFFSFHTPENGQSLRVPLTLHLAVAAVVLVCAAVSSSAKMCCYVSGTCGRCVSGCLRLASYTWEVQVTRSSTEGSTEGRPGCPQMHGNAEDRRSHVHKYVCLGPGARQCCTAFPPVMSLDVHTRV